MMSKVRSKYSPWLTIDIERQMHHQDYLKKKGVQTGSAHIQQVYKQAKNYLNKVIKKAKVNYNKKSFKEICGNPKAAWNV